MALLNKDHDRKVLPRLHDIASSADAGELGPLRNHTPMAPSADALTTLLHDWSSSPTVSVASDLVCSAAISGNWDIAQQAAVFVKEHPNAPLLARDMANFYLAGGQYPNTVPTNDNPLPRLLHDSIGRKIHQSRSVLALYPRTGVLWASLARLYICVGVEEKATLAIRQALALAPDNRYVLRSAARLFAHLGEREQAHAILLQSSSVRYDPWVLAAEVAAADVLGKSSSLLRIAQRLLERNRFAAHDLSELASAVGTLEAQNGNRKKARNLIRLSLQRASENAVAQAAWLSRNRFVVNSSDLPQGVSPEEAAWTAFNQGNWTASLRQAHKWQMQEPFSSRPALLASYVATAPLEIPDVAINTCRIALRANRNHPILINNLAFSLIQKNQLADARKYLNRTNNSRLDTVQRLTLQATGGLLCFRTGNPQEGRLKYLEAINGFRGNNSQAFAAASLFLALEELRVQSADADYFRHQALDAFAKATETEKLPLLAQAERIKSFSTRTLPKRLLP